MLEINQINVFYGDLQALWNVSLTVRAREIAALVGSNGAGKSTLLKAICGLLKLTNGTIRFNGLHIDKTPAYQIVQLGICLVHEGRRLFPEMSVLENLEMGAFNRKARKKGDETIAWVYDIFPRLKDRRNQTAGTLSGGEQQMLAIARVLVSGCELILLDEPSEGLAPLLVGTIMDTIQELKKSGLTMLLVEANLTMASNLGDRHYVMAHGLVACEANTQQILEDTELQKKYFKL
jgi:branched-chain amino acid transport system ATP-binding protein